VRSLSGVISAVVTPLNEDLSPDAAIAVPYYRALLANGCSALNILGTTGEAMSLSVSARRRFMEQLARELPRERLMAGTGASALEDAAELTRAAIDLGFAAALIIPPFYYRDIPDDRTVAFFDALFSRVAPPEASIMLYNFPRMSGITFTPGLVDRLVCEFPGIIAGLKDSSNTADLEIELHRRQPSLRVFPGSEGLLQAARHHGLAGCISGSVALWPQIAARAWEHGNDEDLAELARLRGSLDGMPLIAAVRARIAQTEDEPAWRRSIPPL
jgi:4-hydroxy-tetrahydrodipicolinate synthase